MKRLTPAALTVVMFGIIGMLVLGYFAKNLFAQKEKPVVNTLRDLPMAITDIKPGTVITADHLGVGKYDRTKLAPDVLLANRVIVGRVAREPIKAAQPIKAGQLYQPGELPPLEIDSDMRAVSVEVGDGVAMVDGIIKPGDHVDVLFTSSGGGGNNDSTYQGGLTMRLFEGIKVLAINRNFSQGKVDRGNNHVTLELTVAQQNIVVLARDRGKITLTYNPNGKGHGGLALSNAERITLYEILGMQKPIPAKDLFTTDIYRGHGYLKNYFDDRGRLMDNSARNQMNRNQNLPYQLPNSNLPSQNPSTSDDPQLNPVPQAAPRPNMNQTMVPIDNQLGQRHAPTAQLVVPRN